LKSKVNPAFQPGFFLGSLCPVYINSSLGKEKLPMADRKSGIVKWFNGEKGYGFATPDDGSKDVFVHHTAILGEGYKNLNEGDRIEFSVEAGEKGPKAAQVAKL
jgi:CspA family cold shock protein